MHYLDEQITTIDTREKLDAVMDQPFEIAEKWAKAIHDAGVPSARSLRLQLPPFTIIGATTRLAMRMLRDIS